MLLEVISIVCNESIYIAYSADFGCYRIYSFGNFNIHLWDTDSTQYFFFYWYSVKANLLPMLGGKVNVSTVFHHLVDLNTSCGIAFTCKVISGLFYFTKRDPYKRRKNPRTFHIRSDLVPDCTSLDLTPTLSFVGMMLQWLIYWTQHSVLLGWCSSGSSIEPNTQSC